MKVPFRDAYDLAGLVIYSLHDAAVLVVEAFRLALFVVGVQVVGIASGPQHVDARVGSEGFQFEASVCGNVGLLEGADEGRHCGEVVVLRWSTQSLLILKYGSSTLYSSWYSFSDYSHDDSYGHRIALLLRSTCAYRFSHYCDPPGALDLASTKLNIALHVMYIHIRHHMPGRVPT